MASKEKPSEQPAQEKRQSTLFSKIKGAFGPSKRHKLKQTIQEANFAPHLNEEIAKEFFQLRQAVRYGLPGEPSVLAYDTAQRLMAVGTYQGAILVYGQQGVERYFDPVVYTRNEAVEDKGNSLEAEKEFVPRIKHRNPIKFLHFKQGDGLLLSVDGKNRLTGWNLVNGLQDFQVTIMEPVTCFCVPAGLDWCFIGTLSGKVIVHSSDRGEDSGVTISCQAMDTALLEPGSLSKASVADIALHPHFPNHLLIGYRCGVIVLWDFLESKVVRRYQLNSVEICPPPATSPSDVELTCLSWKTDGSAFISGYDNGQYAAWSYTSDKKAITSRLVNGENGIKLDPVYQTLVCSSMEQRDTFWLLVSGGDPSDSSNMTSIVRGLRIFEFENLNDSKASRMQFISTLDKCINHAIVTPAESPWCNQQLDPSAVIMITDDSHIHAYDLTVPGFPPLRLHPSLDFVNSSKVRQVNISFSMSTSNWFRLVDMEFAYEDRNKTSIAPVLPMVCGGVKGAGMMKKTAAAEVIAEHKREKHGSNESLGPTLDTLNDLMVTCHEDNSIRFWDLSSSITMRELKSLGVYSAPESAFEGLSVRPGKITFIEFFPDDLVFVACFSNGVVVVYEFSDEVRIGDPVPNVTEMTGLSIDRLQASHVSGFQPTVRTVFWDENEDVSYSCIAFNSKAHMLAIALKSGRLLVVSTKALTVILDETISAEEEKKSDIIEQLLFVSTAIPLKDMKLEPMDPTAILLAGCDSGAVLGFQLDFVLNSQTQQVLPTYVKDDVCKHESSIIYLAVLSPVGDFMVLDNITVKTKRQEPTEELSKGEKRKNETKDKSTEKLNKSMEKLSMENVDELYCLTLVCRKDFCQVLRNISGRVEFEYKFKKGDHLIKAQVVEFQFQILLFCVYQQGDIEVLSLPQLRPLFRSNLIDDSLESRSVTIGKEGRVAIWNNDKEVKQFYIFANDNRHNIPSSYGNTHDSLIAIPSRLVPDMPAENPAQWFGTITKAFTGGLQWATDEMWKEREASLNKVLRPMPAISTSHEKRQQKRTARKRSSEPEDDEPDTQQKPKGNNAFSHAREGLEERGERLQRLDGKFNDLASNSKDFLETVREYNRKQKEKKWYEF